MSWEAPKGYVLTKHDGYQVNANGFAWNAGEALMPDGQIDVAWPVDDEPFVWSANTKSEHPHPAGQVSQEALDAAAAGTPLEGWNPNVVMKPIQGGYVPPVYHLVHEDDETHGAVEPGSLLGTEGGTL